VFSCLASFAKSNVNGKASHTRGTVSPPRELTKELLRIFTHGIMDGLSGAASIITVIDISAKVVSLCFHYSLAVKDAKRDIERLQNKVTDIKDILEEIRRLLDGQDKIQFSATRKLLDSLKECQRQLQGLHAQLEPHRGRKVMQRIGFRALKWPFTGKQVEKMVNSLEQYEQTFSLALQVDQT
jgi:hypothetical protein